MKMVLILLVLFIITISSYSQIEFEKGYIVDTLNAKTDCLIKNVDWSSNPSTFQYKLTQGSQVKFGTVDNIKEFGVYNDSKYVRFKVNIDRSSDNVDAMSDKQNPIFNTEELFLKEIIVGSADLYGYTDGIFQRFFYRVDDTNPEQLVYKRFKLLPDNSLGRYEGKIGVNNTFKQQLWNDLKCPSITLSKVEKLEYKSASLRRFFDAYNACINPEYVEYVAKEKRDWFNLTIRPGVNFTSFSLDFIEKYRTFTFDFDSQTNFRFGLEAEFSLGFNKNKWAIIIEPTFQQSFKANTELDNGIGIITFQVDYNSFEVPFGLRYYLFLNSKSKLFVNALFSYNIDLESSIENNTPIDLYLSSGPNLCFGMGYKYNDKFSLEGRYFTNREILNSFISWHSDYKTFSVILGYTLF